MAADWTLYAEDALAELYNTGSGTVAGVNDSGSTATAGLAVDINQVTQWAPGAAASRDFQTNLGSSKTIEAVFIGGHNLSGLGIELRSGATFGAFTTPRKTYTFTSNDDACLTFTAAAAQFWTLRITSPVSASRVGTVALLTSAGKIALAATYGPAYPVGWGLAGGWVSIDTAGGSRVTQVLGGVRRAITLNVRHASVAAGNLWATVESLFKSTNGFSRGLVLTDDTFDTAAGTGIAHYGLPADAMLAASIVSAGARVECPIHIVTLPKDLGA